MTNKPTWRTMWRYYSVQALALCAAIPLIWQELPPEVLALLPAEWMPWIVAAVAVAGIIGRRIPQ